MSRLLCIHCQRPPRTCLCDLVQQVSNVTDVLILQHPLEQHQAKGSATLLQRCLSQCRIVVGEQFDLIGLLSDTGPARQNILLYPPDATPSAAAINSAQPLPQHLPPQYLSPQQLSPAQTRLIVLDGTWRKTRKLLHLHPQLASMPRLQLHNLPASRYHIRKAHSAAQLSTLEACCFALGQIEANSERYQPVLAAFDQFNSKLAQFSPHK